jgi:vacuolar-type H+-ATPase subunit E/Vma4
LVGWSTITVAIGVLLEGIELVHAFNEWRKRKRRENIERVHLTELGQIVPIGIPRRLSRSHSEEPPWVKLVLRIGLILVVIGVVGEWRCGAKLEDAHEAVHVYDLAKLTEADQKAGAAAKSAKIAHEEADAVKGIADEARADAKDALAKAQAAQRELAHAEADAVKAQAISSNALSKAAEAESHLAEAMRGVKALEADLERLRTPRHLYHKAKIAPLLKEFSGTEYVFIGTCEDQECFDLVSDIDELLQLAGWKRIKGPPLRIGIAQFNIHGDKDFSVDASVSIGTTISTETPNGFDAIKSLPDNQQAKHIRAAVALNRVLASNISPPENTGKHLGIDTGTSTAVRIDVGRKPL